MLRISAFVAALVAGTALSVGVTPGEARETVVNAPAPTVREAVSANRETALFAGGCFWGVQGVFSHVKGVTSATSGYAGGKAATARYALVSTGTTGHAEAVRLVFDSRQVNYADLLRIYFSVVADPTEINHQGPDDGPQYRTALFPLSQTQASVAGAYIKQLSAAHVYARPIATRLEQQSGFFAAEDYHQNFMSAHPNDPYIVINDRPKVEALKRMFPQIWKS